jgi:flagellar motor switch protein FliG
MLNFNQFKVPGGLKALVRLVESSSPEKKEALLLKIAKEDPGWAHLILNKCLTLDRIFTWTDQSLEAVLSRLPLPYVAILCQIASEENLKKIERCVARSLLLDLRQVRKDKQFSPTDRKSVPLKVIESVREMISSGVLDLEQVDPALVIDPRLVA